MYIPKYFKQNDRKKSIAFMNAYNFAIVVSAKDELPLATHLPFVIEERENEIVLISHMSKANEQWKTFSDKDVLVIFSEPHAYISPSLYEQKQNVPTWNYVAVHAYGKIHILDSNEEKLIVLHKQMQSYEAGFIEQFRTLDKKYIDGLLQGIIAFEITVSNLQAKEKLNQNKSEKDRLEESEDEMKRTLGKMM